MKIAISSFGDKLNSSIDNRFGRCQNFLILDEEGELEKTIDNEGANLAYAVTEPTPMDPAI